jgi:hypothetical protein
MSISQDVPETVSVGPSSLIGELSLIDGLARGVTATSRHPLRGAVTPGAGTAQQDDPHTAWLMFAVACAWRSGCARRTNFGCTVSWSRRCSWRWTT